ncbi:DUF4186 family protein [Streptomyces sp. NPDC051219]|uniref:DUF4186 family protein n=1 Tax=Streptomyces sp. NPDC051219 TaxID=3155283 RepID=UPI003429EFE2
MDRSAQADSHTIERAAVFPRNVRCLNQRPPRSTSGWTPSHNIRSARSSICAVGKQTPYGGHPVFVAQHATATCCRTCLQRWHQIPKGRELSRTERAYVVNVAELRRPGPLDRASFRPTAARARLPADSDGGDRGRAPMPCAGQ